MTRLLVKSCLTAVLLLMSVLSFAQTSGDKLFMDGQKLQSVQTVSSQKQAIKKFQSAKVVYTTSEKKQMCDNQIKICNSNIASLSSKKSNGSSRGSHKTSTTTTKEEPVLFALSEDNIEFDGDKPGNFCVNVQAPSLDWKFEIPQGVDGETEFVKVARSNDAKSINISADANNTTLVRTQTVNVSHQSVTKTIKITQQGKDVKLSTDANLIEFGKKGGSKSLEVYTNSDSIIASNNNNTWYVESKPDWITINVDVKKKQSFFGKGLSAIKGLVKGKAEASLENDVKQSNIKVVATALKKTEKEFETGRRGEIIFVSQDKKYKVDVVQQK